MHLQESQFRRNTLPLRRRWGATERRAGREAVAEEEFLDDRVEIWKRHSWTMLCASNENNKTTHTESFDDIVVFVCSVVNNLNIFTILQTDCRINRSRWIQ
jgi:hypothetical protein